MTLRYQIFLFFFATASCSSVVQKKIEIRSNPSGAAVSSLDGKNLGVTPLTLTGEVLKENSQNNRLAIQVSLPGYSERELLVDVRGDDQHTLNLSKLDTSYFKQKVMEGFIPEANRMSRQLLTIHGMVLTRQVAEARRVLEQFQEQYPNIASGYVLSANIDLIDGKSTEARQSLSRALTLDPEDPVAARMLNGEKRKEESAQP